MQTSNIESSTGVLENMGIGRIRSIIQITRKLYGDHTFSLLILTVLGFISGLTEALGIGILVPLFSYVVNGGSLGNDFISRTLFALFSYFHLKVHLSSLLILICSLFVFKALILLIFGYVNVYIMANYESNMKKDLYKNALSASWSYLLSQKIGYLQYVIEVHVGFVVRLFQQISNNILGFTAFIMYVIVAYKLSPLITMITLGLGFMILLVFRPLILNTKRYSKERAKVEIKINHYVNENIVGIKTIKAMGIEREVKSVAHDFFEQLKKMRIKLQSIKNISSVFIQPLGLIFISVIFAIFYLRPHFEFAMFVAVMYLIQRIFGYVDKIQGSSYVISEAIPYVNNMLEFEEALATHKESEEGNARFLFEKELEFKNVGFTYPNGTRVFEAINFKIKQGEMIGIVGPSGSGKTTLVDLLLRLFKPEKGEIFLDHTNAHEIKLEEWRRSIGYVSQDIFLKNDTIANNITFYDHRVTHEDMLYGARSSNIYDFIQTLPKGFDTVVGERGVLLSVGQRQRIVLARVLSRRPKVLVLDEATSALDNESEVMIKKAIDDLKGAITVIIIAHRLSTIMGSDRLIALENGRIIEEGVPEKLLKDKNSYFYKVYNVIS